MISKINYNQRSIIILCINYLHKKNTSNSQEKSVNLIEIIHAIPFLILTKDKKFVQSPSTNQIRDCFVDEQFKKKYYFLVKSISPIIINELDFLKKNGIIEIGDGGFALSKKIRLKLNKIERTSKNDTFIIKYEEIVRFYEYKSM